MCCEKKLCHVRIFEIFVYVIRGYAKRHILEGLEAQTLYRYRIRFQNDEGNSEWSQVTSVSTTSKSAAYTAAYIHMTCSSVHMTASMRVIDLCYLY